MCGSFEALVQVALVLISIQQELHISIQIAAGLGPGKGRAAWSMSNKRWAQRLVLPVAGDAAPVPRHAAGCFTYRAWYWEVQLPIRSINLISAYTQQETHLSMPQPTACCLT